MNQDLFITDVTGSDFPTYPCPSCEKQDLRKVSFLSVESGATKKNRGEDWWEPEYDEHIFNMTMECSSCGETVFATGDGYIDEEVEIIREDHWERNYVLRHRPKYFFPALKFIECPAATPKEVQRNLESASSIYFSNPASACNSLRIAAEGIMTSLGVPEPEPGDFVSFGNRIKALAEESVEYKLLNAIRWLGNNGSHADTLITHKDAQDAFEVMDFLIEEVYSDRKKKINEIASLINEHKGPVRLRGSAGGWL